MERTSDKHSPRVDDEMRHDLQSMRQGGGGESRAQESRTQEDDGDIDVATRGDDAHAPGIGVSVNTADERAELARHLAAAQWPATRDELLAAAADSHAPDEVLVRLNRLPQDGTRYHNVQDVWQAGGGDVEESHTGHHEQGPGSRDR